MCIYSRATIYIQMLPFQEQEEQKGAADERARKKKQESERVVLQCPCSSHCIFKAISFLCTQPNEVWKYAD